MHGPMVQFEILVSADCGVYEVDGGCFRYCMHWILLASGALKETRVGHVCRAGLPARRIQQSGQETKCAYMKHEALGLAEYSSYRRCRCCAFRTWWSGSRYRLSGVSQ